MGYPERIRDGLDRFLHLKLTRGEFILTGTAGSLAMTGIGLYTADRNTPIDPDYDVYPGWPESHIKAPFLQADKGHFHFLREGIFSNPDILGTTKDVFGLIGERLDKKEVLPLGEALKFCQDRMRERLTGKRISPNANFELEVLHGAFFAFTAGYTAQWFPMDDLRIFGVPEKFKTLDEYNWGPEGVARCVFPGYFSTGELDDPNSGEVKQGGQDRSGHIVHHAFLAFELMYSEAHNIRLDKNMPLFARFLVWFGNIGSVEQMTTTFSDRVGMFYEISKLINPNFWPFDGRTPRDIADGPWDDTVNLDYKGNRLGVNFGILAHKLVNNRDGFEALLYVIDNRFKRFDEEPQIFNSKPT